MFEGGRGGSWDEEEEEDGEEGEGEEKEEELGREGVGSEVGTGTRHAEFVLS